VKPLARNAGIQIGELARRSGCNVETVGGYRLYETAFARRARELGFTLEEVGTLMALSTHNVRSACAEVRQLAADHLAVVRAKIADLQTIEGVLADAVLRYDVDELPGCPLIKTLSEEVLPTAELPADAG